MSLLRSQLLRTALRPRAVTQVAWTRAASSSIPEPQNPLQPFQPDESTPKSSQQSPNVPTTWSTSQNPKPHVQNNARFEQTNLDLQPNAPSAMGMVAEDPIRLVDGRRASCDGGGGPLGHPRVYINLDKPGPKACGYWYVAHITPMVKAYQVVESDSNKLIITTRPGFGYGVR